MERRKRAFMAAHEGLPALLRARGVDFAAPIPDGDVALAELAKAHPHAAAVAAVLPLHAAFDDLDYEIRTPAEWLQLGVERSSGEQRGVPAQALWEAPGTLTSSPGTGREVESTETASPEKPATQTTSDGVAQEATTAPDTQLEGGGSAQGPDHAPPQAAQPVPVRVWRRCRASGYDAESGLFTVVWVEGPGNAAGTGSAAASSQAGASQTYYQPADNATATPAAADTNSTSEVQASRTRSVLQAHLAAARALHGQGVNPTLVEGGPLSSAEEAILSDIQRAAGGPSKLGLLGGSGYPLPVCGG